MAGALDAGALAFGACAPVRVVKLLIGHVAAVVAAVAHDDGLVATVASERFHLLVARAADLLPPRVDIAPVGVCVCVCMRCVCVCGYVCVYVHV